MIKKEKKNEEDLWEVRTIAEALKNEYTNDDGYSHDDVSTLYYIYILSHIIYMYICNIFTIYIKDSIRINIVYIMRI